MNTTSAAAAASTLSVPRSRSRPSSALSSAATRSPFSFWREPMTTSSPASAQRNASPGPCSPVPPRMAIFTFVLLYPKNSSTLPETTGTSRTVLFRNTRNKTVSPAGRSHSR